MLYQVEKASGEVLVKTMREDISKNLPDKLGFLQMTGMQNGWYHSEEWRVESNREKRQLDVK